MNEMLELPISRLYAKFLPAAIISMLISTVASLIDTIVVSFFMGPVALSAVNICMPIYSILSAVALLIVGGAGTLYSQFLGKSDKVNAHKIFTLAVATLVVIGVLYSIFGIIFTEQIVKFLGANDAVLDMAVSYARVLFWFALIDIVFPLMQAFVRMDMEPALTVVAIVACAITNAVLDVLLVGPFLSPEGFGTTGAAFATCIAYCVAFLILLSHFFKKRNTLRLAGGFASGKSLGKIIVTGIPASITLFGSAITLAVYNNFIIVRGEGYGVGVGELYVSVYSVIVQVMSIAMAVYVGIAQCAQPLFAANSAAGRNDRLKELFTKGLKLEIILNIILAVIFCLLAEKIAMAFSLDKGAYDMTETAVIAIRCFSLSMVFAGVNQIIIYLLQTTKKVKESSIISALQGIVLPIVGLYLLAGVILKGNPDGIGVWLTFIFAQGLTMIVAIIIYKKVSKQ